MIGNNLLKAPGQVDYYGPNVHFRHNGVANVAYVDGHAKAATKKANVSSSDGTLGDLSADASADLQIIHQDHDYSHLPDGQQHYRLPETGENVRLAGGWRTIFVLDDASHQLRGGKLSAFPLSWKKFWREVQHFPLLKWHNYALTQIFFTLFHPKRAWVEFWKKRAFQNARKEA